IRLRGVSWIRIWILGGERPPRQLTRRGLLIWGSWSHRPDSNRRPARRDRLLRPRPGLPARGAASIPFGPERQPQREPSPAALGVVAGQRAPVLLGDLAADVEPDPHARDVAALAR